MNARGLGVVRAVLALGSVAGLTVGAVVLPSTSAGAASSYEGSAQSQGILQTVANDSFPFGITFQAAGPTTTALLSSLDDSRATALFADPGETVLTLPGTGCSLYQLQCPEYPFIVSTSLGDKPKTAEFGVSSLAAESRPDAARATGTAGSAASGGSASSLVAYDRTADSLTATATAAYNGADLGGLVTVTGVRVLAETSRAADGKRTDATSLSISRINSPGLVLHLPESTPGSAPLPNPIPGLPQAPPLTLPSMPNALGGRTLVGPDIGFVDGVFTVTTPVDGKPMTFAVPAAAIAEAFAAQGVTFRFQQAQTTPTGVVSPALQISFSLPAPPDNPGFNGPTRVTTTLGNAAASTSLVPETATGDVPVGAPGPSAGATGGAVDAATGALPALGDIAAGGQVPVGANGALGLPTASLLPAGPGTGEEIRLASSAADLDNVYLLTVAVAALCLGGAAVLRNLGVRI